jgi:hypothetical protein
MRRPAGWICAAALGLAAPACGGDTADARRPAGPSRAAAGDRGDAEVLGREVFELVDRALDYRGSHRGRPAASLPQMGIESLTPATVRRVANVGREPLITVAFRRPQGRAFVSCRGDGRILEEAALNGGRFTVMCTANSGEQRLVQVGAP